MVQPVKNYRRFYAAFNKLQHGGDDDECKSLLVAQYTNGRTSHLHEMTGSEYTAMCKALEAKSGYNDQRKRHRSIALHLMQALGIDTKDWQRINDFCRHPRISGKPFAQLNIEELEALQKKLRAIQRKGGLGSEDNKNIQPITIINYGTRNQQQASILPC